MGVSTGRPSGPNAHTVLPPPPPPPAPGGAGPAPAAIAVVAVQASHLLGTLVPPLEGAAQHWAANLFVDFSVLIAFVLVVTTALRYRGSRLGLPRSPLAPGRAPH